MTPWPYDEGGVGEDAAERWAIATLDHFAAKAGYRSLLDARPASGGWRRRYLGEDGRESLAAVGGAGSRFASLGVEIAAPRARVESRAHALVSALAAYEVAVDPDAGADPQGEEAVVRVALRLFLDGLTEGAVRDACGTLAAAAAEARRVLGVTSRPRS